MRKRLLLLILILAALLLAACGNSGRQPPPAGPKGPPPGGLPPAGGMPGAQPPGPPRPAEPSTPPPAPPGPSEPAPAAAQPKGTALQPQKPAQDQSLSNAATLMALGRGRRILPEDFKIGPLGDDRGTAREENLAAEAAEAFLASLVAGRIDRKLLSPESEQTIADTLSYGLSRGYAPTSYRLGAPKSRDNGEITARVRLFGPTGSAEGDIYVAPAGTRWLVADLQLSLAQLAVKRDTAKEKFFPLEYRWLLEE